MEERVPPATATAATPHHQEGDPRFRHRHRDNVNAYDDNNYNHHHHGMQIDSSDNKNNTNNNNHPDGRPVQTYIVRIPKDQIYRVPPPEHAKIVESYRNPTASKRRCPRCMCWCLSIFFTLACLISIIVCVYRFTLNPKPPTFSVKHFAVKQPKKNGSPPGFQISVGTENPNSNTDVEYEKGSATLEYKEKEVAKGNFPALDMVAPGKSDSDNVVLEGSPKAGLPEKPKWPVNLDLKMSVPVKMKTWMFTKDKEIKVECEFEVNSLGENPKVLSQNCVNKD